MVAVIRQIFSVSHHRQSLYLKSCIMKFWAVLALAAWAAAVPLEDASLHKRDGTMKHLGFWKVSQVCYNEPTLDRAGGSLISEPPLPSSTDMFKIVRSQQGQGKGWDSD